jgi:RNA polymerase sigma-70 factor (ECF subfamily)
MADVTPDSAETCRLLEQVGRGDRAALDALLERHRPGLVSFVELRLDPKVRGRLDASDVVQEAQLEAARRMSDFLERRPMPFHLWVRKAAYQRLLNARRDHRRARRSVEREEALPDSSSLLLAQSLLSGGRRRASRPRPARRPTRWHGPSPGSTGPTARCC